MAEVDITHKATISLEGSEIRMLKALCQNPHPNYEENEELMEFASELFNTLRSLIGPN